MTPRPPTPPNRRDGTRRNRRRISATALLVLLLTALPWGGTTAHAHASLLSSEPSSGANLPEAPETLRLTFNEDVTLLETTRLTGPDGAAAYTSTVDGGLVELRPGEPLRDGRWDLVWQIVSADGHLVGGVLTFTVGDADPSVGDANAVGDAAPDSTAGATPYTAGTSSGDTTGTGTPGTLDRILELLAWLTLIGALGALIAGRRTPAAWLGAGAVLAPVLRVVDSVDRWGTSAWVVGETRAALAATVAGAIVLTGALLQRRTGTTVGTLAAGIIAVLTWSAQAFLSGHPNVVDPRAVTAALSALHLAGALTWSAAVSAALMNPARARHASRIATIGIAALLPAALLLAGAFIPTALESGAGRWETILGAKAVLVLGALAIGWRNHRACRCGTCRHSGCACPLDADAQAALRRRTSLEIGLIALVAVLSASLTTSIPARVAGERPGGAAETSSNAPSGTDAIDTDVTGATSGESTPTDTPDEPAQVQSTLLFENGETGELLVEIGTDGGATIHLVLRDALGQPFTAEQVEYELENPGTGVAGISGQLPVNGGMHMGETNLPGGGTWRISVNATYDTFTTINATTEIETPRT